MKRSFGQVLFSAAIVLTFLIAKSAGATIIYSATLDSPVQFVDPPHPFQPRIATYSFVPTIPKVPTTPHPGLTGNFALDKQFQITYSAPAGMRFQISGPPAGSDSFSLFADLWSVNGLGPTGSLNGLSYSFSGAVGVAPTLIESTFTQGVQPSDMRAGDAWSVAGAFGFQSVTMTFAVPVTFNFNFVDFTPPIVRLGVTALYLDPSLYPDPPPARFLNLVDITQVPEPATLALLGLGLAGLGFSRRKQ